MEAEDDLHRLSSLFGKDKLKTLLPLWYQGIVFQVTKMPPDIQIDKWIYSNFKDLRPIQLKCLKTQLINAVQGLSEDLRKITPSKIYTVSNVMNYAFFKILEDHLGVDFVAPYHQTVFLFDGSALARMTEREYVNIHEGDVEMINKWADQLNLTTWFEWKHFDDMPGDYLS